MNFWIINRLFVIFNIWNKSVNSWTYQLYYYAFSSIKMAKFKMDAFLRDKLTMAYWIRLSLLCRCKWTRKSELLRENVSEQYLFFYDHKSVYCVYTRNLGANLWLLLGAKSMPFGCMSMGRLGAKYMDTFGCMSMPFGCMSMAQLGACMRLLGACLTVGSFAWL